MGQEEEGTALKANRTKYKNKNREKLKSKHFLKKEGRIPRGFFSTPSKEEEPWHDVNDNIIVATYCSAAIKVLRWENKQPTDNYYCI